MQKVAGELYMQSYWRVYGLETVCLRYFNIFGPRQVPDSPYSGVMAKFCLQMLKGEQPVILGDGEQGRDFTYIDNAVEANLLAPTPRRTSVRGGCSTWRAGERHTLNETYGLLAKMWAIRSPRSMGRRGRAMCATRSRIFRRRVRRSGTSRAWALKKGFGARRSGTAQQAAGRG